MSETQDPFDFDSDDENESFVPVTPVSPVDEDEEDTDSEEIPPLPKKNNKGTVKDKVKEKLSTPAPPKKTRKPVVEDSFSVAKEIRKERMLPEPPCKQGATVKPQVAWRWLGSLTQDQFDRLAPYVYRIYPIINNNYTASDGDAKKNIGFLQSGQEDAFRTQFGGGKYRVVVNDTDTRATLFIFYVEFPWADLLPVLDLNTLVVDHKDNVPYIMYLKNKGLWHGAISGKEEKPSDSALNARLLDMMQTQLEKAQQKPDRNSELALMEEIYKKGLEMQNPQNQLQLITSLMGTLKQTPELSTKDVLMMLSEKDKTIMELLMKATAPREVVKEKNHIEELKNTVATLKELGLPFGESPEPSIRIPSGPTWQDRLIDLVGNILPPALQMGLAYMQSQQAGASTPANNVPVNPLLPAPSPVSAVTPNSTPQGIQPDMLNPQRHLLAQALQANVTPIINAFEKDDDGVAFADWIIQGFGKPTYIQLANFGAEELLEASKMVPELKTLMGKIGEPNVKKWLEDFCNYDSLMKEEEKNEDKDDLIK